MYDSEGTAKAVPGKALIKTLVTRESNSQASQQKSGENGSTVTSAAATSEMPISPVPATYQWADVSTSGSRCLKV